MSSQQDNEKAGIASLLDKYGPNIDTTHVQSELKCLESTSTMKDFVRKDRLTFNYEFDYDSYNQYSKTQNAARIQLTKIRKYLENQFNSQGYGIGGYYYELTDIMNQGNQQFQQYQQYNRSNSNQSNRYQQQNNNYRNNRQQYNQNFERKNYQNYQNYNDRYNYPRQPQ